MRTVSLFLIQLFLFALNSAGQFEWLSPSPTGNNLTSSWFMNQDTGIVVGYGGDILRTGSGGASWQRHVFDEYPEWGYDFSSVFFLNDYTGFITGTSGAIFKTTDGGLTWTEKYGCQNCEVFTDIFFSSPDSGWVVGKYGAFRRTTNGGENWVSLSGFPLDQVDLYSVWFVDDQHGWAAGADHIVRLSEAGTGWEFISYDDSFYDICFVDNNTGWICGTRGKVLYTANGGDNWQIIQTPVNVTLMEIKFTDLLNGWAVGAEGTILRSDDGGQTWSHYVPVTDRTLQSIFPASDQEIFITGNGGTILKSEDGGEFWEFPVTSTIIDDITDITFSDENTGWAATYNGKIFKTTDGGYHWMLSHYYDAFQLTSITSTDPGHVWAAGTYIYPVGVILHSGDGGQNWAVQDENVNQLHDITFTDLMHGWAVGLNGVIYHTDNGGTQWNLQVSGAQNDLNSVYFLDNQNGLAGGYNEVVQTYNGGITWEPQEVFFGNFWLLTNVYAFDPVHRFASGDMYLYYADYPGSSWNQGSQNPSGVRDVAYYTPQFLWEVGNNGLLLKRSSTWDYYSITTNDLNAIYIDPENSTGYAAGEFGTIIKINLEYWIGVDEFQHGKSTLVFEVAPNPAAGMLDCRWSMADSRRITLKICDIQGRDLITVLDEMKPAGDHCICIDVSDFLPGIYFCRLTAGDEVAGAKVIVTR